MERNPYLQRYRAESLILGKRNATWLNQPVLEGDPSNLKSHLLQIRGGEDGHYFNSHNKRIPSRMVLLEEQLKEVEQKWNNYCQDRLNVGEPKPVIWPEHLQEQKDRLEAKLQVANEEVRWLSIHLQKAEDQKPESRGNLLSNPRYWGTGNLRDGHLVRIAGWDVAPDDTGLLRISDPTSPYDGIEVWRFKAQVVNPMHYENRLRGRKETKEALEKNRSKKSIPFPKPPTFDPVSGNIEYQGYSNETIRKIKIDDT